MTFEEFLDENKIKNEAMSIISNARIGSDISMIPLQIVMRDEIGEIKTDDSCNIFVNPHQADFYSLGFSYEKKQQCC